MSKLFVRGTSYDRMGTEAVKFKLEEDDVIRSLNVTEDTADEFDQFLEEKDFPFNKYTLIAEISGNGNILKELEKDGGFGVMLEEYTFGVGRTKEIAMAKWEEAMRGWEKDDGWDD